MTYRIELNHVAQKQFRRLERQTQKQLKPHIQSLQCGLNPRCKKLTSYDNRYRLLILLLAIAHRKDVYRNLSP